jgi:PAS domain S-box-containing protein
VILVAALILTLYGWAFVADVKSISAALLVSDRAAIIAAIALVLAFVSYLWAPKKLLFGSAYALFLLLCVAVTALIADTGLLASPFIALWMLLCIFAGIFGAYGLVPLFLAVTAYMVFGVTGGSLGRESIVTLVLMGELPLIASYIIWHTKSGEGDQGKDRAYRELATELSQVAGKSEVVINAIADGVIALDGQGIIQLINPAAQQIIGWGKQDALSLNYKSVLKLTDNKNAELTPANDPVSQVLATNKEITTDNLILLTNSGKKRLVSIVISPVGQLGSCVIVVFRDITSEKEEERQQAEFISTASHEMRTPVASIEGYLGLALNPATAQIDDKARDYITKAHESAEHLGRLFQDLLDVSKAEDGRLSNNPKVVDVVAFLHDIVQGLTPKAEAKGLRIHYKPLPDGLLEKLAERTLNPVYYTNVDNDHLREVASNLIENAIKYTLKGDVTIDVQGDNDHVVISVADSGIGIPKEDQAHLFQKFYRVDNSDTREIGGTGLGLYLCRRLAETMNGRIWVESEYKQGSTFYLELPRLDHEDATRLIETAALQPVAPEMPTITMTNSAPLPVEQPAPDAPQPQPVIQPAPVAPPQPYIPPMPQPTQMPQPTPAIQQAPNVQQAPLIRPGLNQNRPNTPLVSIEQNPSQYLSPRAPGVSVPPRDQN